MNGTPVVELCAVPACTICDRSEGDCVDRCGVEDGVPLGEVVPCEVCGRPACPDCVHERDCCFLEADAHRGDPAWAPPGWRVHRVRAPGWVEYRLIGASP